MKFGLRAEAQPGQKNDRHPTPTPEHTTNVHILRHEPNTGFRTMTKRCWRERVLQVLMMPREDGGSPAGASGCSDLKRPPTQGRTEGPGPLQGSRGGRERAGPRKTRLSQDMLTLNLILGMCTSEHIIEGWTYPQPGTPGKWGTEVQPPVAGGQRLLPRGILSTHCPHGPLPPASPAELLAQGDRCQPEARPGVQEAGPGE